MNVAARAKVHRAHVELEPLQLELVGADSRRRANRGVDGNRRDGEGLVLERETGDRAVRFDRDAAALARDAKRASGVSAVEVDGLRRDRCEAGQGNVLTRESQERRGGSP